MIWYADENNKQVDIAFLILWLLGSKESVSGETTFNFYLH